MLIEDHYWKSLEQAIQKEKAIMGYRNTAENLKELHQKGRAVAILDGQEGLIAFGGLWNTLDVQCLEAGSFWVHPKYRGRKFSTRMFEQLSGLIEKGKISVCITHNEKIVHLLQKNSWTEATADSWEVNVPFHVSCGPCDVVSEGDKKMCSFKAKRNHCRMFFKLG